MSASCHERPKCMTAHRSKHNLFDHLVGDGEQLRMEL
jgi:hypothetical protein